MNKALIIVALIGLIAYLYPFAVMLRLKGLGAKRCGCKEPCERVFGPMWAKIKGETTLTHNSMPVKFTLQKDCVSLRLLWGPSVCIKLANYSRVERVIKSGHTVAVRFVPNGGDNSRSFSLEGIIDFSPLFANLAQLGLNAVDVEAKKNLLGM